jgi:tRNA pseudouridine13 synthase
MLSKTRGTGGAIKASSEDFEVEEITERGRILSIGRRFTPGELGEAEDPEGKFTRFVLEKKNWDTPRAIREIAHRLGRGWKSISYAGMKDRISTSTQLASIYGIKPEDLNKVAIRDIRINCAWLSNEQVRLGSLIGNHFKIVITDAEDPEAAHKTIDALGGSMPNYFDAQRFGIRQNNVSIGLHLLKGEYKEAAISFLTDTKNERDAEAVEARGRLLDNMDFSAARGYFPKYLRYERQVIDYLARYPDNFANALRMLPRGLTLMFIHSVEDAIFNASLEYMIKNEFYGIKIWCGENSYGFQDMGSVSAEKKGIPVLPLIGYETDDGTITDREKELLDAIGITKDAFKIKGIPELSMKGAFRACLSKVNDIRCETEDKLVKMSFSLPAGSYATIFIREITKNKSIEISDIAQELNI